MLRGSKRCGVCNLFSFGLAHKHEGVSLRPGETTKLIAQKFDTGTIRLDGYSTGNGEQYIVTGLIKKGFFGRKVVQ